MSFRIVPSINICIGNRNEQQSETQSKWIPVKIEMNVRQSITRMTLIASWPEVGASCLRRRSGKERKRGWRGEH